MPSKAEPKAPKKTKSDAVRRVFSSMKADGTEPKPVEIQRKLAAEGVDVSAAQISQVLKSMRGDKAANGKRNAMFSKADLIAANRFINKIGSPAKAKELIEALVEALEVK